MELLINKVENGAEFEGKIFDFWVMAQTKYGNSIKIFDSLTFDLRGKELTTINALLLAGFIVPESVENSNFQILSGKIISDTELEQYIWTKKRNEIFKKKLVGLESNDGIYLLSSIELEEKGIAIGQHVNLKVGRIDLVAIE